ncbi:MAG TPA: hypothetical protein VMH83_11285 [Candidatus Acidoferrum sp.]|nr:hypothetical protein [Candidatus Acidoferrum sp.]
MVAGQFIRHCHQATGGWMPLAPLTQHVVPGDFCRMHDAGLRVLGNIARLGFAPKSQPHETEFTVPDGCLRLSHGVHQVFRAEEYCEDDAGARQQATRHALQFDAAGSFIFSGSRPRYRMIRNWHDFEIDITVKLTQAEFAFRDLYVVTQLLRVDEWALAIAGETEARLEQVAAHRSGDHFQLFSHPASRGLQCKGIAVYQKSDSVAAHFFKARKLTLRQAKKDALLNRVLAGRHKYSEQEKANWLEQDALNLVEANELNIATCLEFFEWRDAGLEDALRLC